MKIVIETIPPEQQRYQTVGDWTFLEPPFVKEGELGISIKVSSLSDWRREALIAVHELIEVLMCKNDGITQEKVDAFDMDYEAHRHPDCDDEPGDDPEAPYHRQHCVATGVERILAASLGVDWKTYEKELFDLPEIPVNPKCRQGP